MRWVVLGVAVLGLSACNGDEVVEKRDERKIKLTLEQEPKRDETRRPISLSEAIRGAIRKLDRQQKRQ